MFCHQIISTELFPTHFAAVGFLPCMDSHMYVQIAHMAELFPTDPAAVRLILGVNPHVHDHAVAVSKFLTTHFTVEQFLPGVDTSVCGQVNAAAEFFATETTAVGFAVSLCVLVWWSWGVWFTTFSQLFFPCAALCVDFHIFTGAVACF